MDPFSQGLVGALVAQAAARKEHTRRATVIGGLSALSADLDVLIKVPGDPMFGIAMHRHFTHALAFTPIGALIVAGLLWLCFRRRLNLRFATIYLFAFLGYLTHGALDACTSYGTVLYWPFSDERVAWNLISIIDPVFTLVIVLMALVLAYWKRSRSLALVGTLLALAYLGFGYWQKTQVAELTRALATSQGHTTEHVFVTQSLGNQFLWRSNYIYNGQMHMQAAYVRPFGPRWIMPSRRVVHYDPKVALPELGAGKQREDFQFFHGFANRLTGPVGDDPYLVGDYRYSLGEGAPLWAIRLNPETPEAAVRFNRSLEARSTRRVSRLWQQMLGHPLSEPAIRYR